MSGRTEVQGAKDSDVSLDVVKWCVAWALVIAGISAYHYFEQFSAVYRALALVPVAAVTLFIAAKTSQGSAFWRLLNEAVIEARRVVWPTRQETVQTTLVVVAVVFVMSLILWGLDSIFGKLISLFIG